MTDLITPTPEDVDEIDKLIESQLQDLDDSSVGIDQCQVCGVELPYSGRGRHRKYCDDHKPTASKRASTPSSSGGTASKRFHDEFLSQWNMLAVTVGIAVNPIDGQILLGGGERLTNSVVHLTEVNPRFKKAMAKAMEATVYGEIVAALAPMAIMIAANHDLVKIPPTMVQTMAQGLGLKLDET